MRTFNRVLRIFSVITLFFFCWSFLPLYAAVAYAAEKQGAGSRPDKIGAKGSGSADPSQSPLGKGGGRGVGATTGERFEKALEAIRENVDRLEKKHALSKAEGADKGEDDAKEREVINTKQAEIESADGEFRREFAATEKKLKDAKLPKEILDRHYKFVKHYEDNLKELKTNLDAVGQYTADSKQGKDAIRKAKLHLERTKTPSKHVPLDPNKLPHRMVKGKERAPRLRKDEFEKDFPQQRHKGTKTAGIMDADSREWMRIALAATSTPLRSPLAKGGYGGSFSIPILLASNAPTSDIPLQLPRPLGERTEVRGDLIPQLNVTLPDFVFSDSNPQSEIRNPHLILAQATVNLPTADDLSETPEVQFTPEIRNIAAQLGNNSLRIYETIRNNYKYEPYYGSLKGAQQTIREKAGNDFDLASLLISLYRSAGIPARYVVATISMPLTQAQSWLGIDDPKMVGRLLASAGVPVAVDYLAGNVRIEHVLVQAWVPYQNGRGALNGPGDTWVYIDPSFKETKVTQILNQTIPSFDQTQYLNQPRATDPAEYYTGSIQEYLNTISPGRTSYAVARHSEIVSLSLGILIGMPQYDIITAGGHFQEIPDQYRYKIAFELTDPELLEASLFYQKATAELAGKRITLSYSPATSQDQSLINSYGDIYSTPAYLVNLKPELKIEGISVAQGLSLGFGNTQAFRMKFISPGGYTEQIENSAVSGAYYAIALDLQTVTQGMVFERTQKLQAIGDIINSGGTVNKDDYTGELLYATALTYFQKLDAANRKSQELLKIIDLRSVSEAIFSIDVQTAYLFGIPKSADISGLHIDVDRDIHLPIPAGGNTAKIKEYNLLIGSNSSYFEHNVIEDIYPTEAISAIKGLQLANAQGIQIYTINESNINSILSTLQIRGDIKTDIVNAVNAGKEIIVPQKEIQVSDWLGLGYIAMNPLTGEAAYIISGGLAGGSSTSMPFFVWIKSQALSPNLAIIATIALIEASMYDTHVFFPGPDNQLGTSDDPIYRIVQNIQVSQWGPIGSECEGLYHNVFDAPHNTEATPVIRLNDHTGGDQLSKNIMLADMISSDSSEFARISPAVIEALELYIKMLEDAGVPLAEKKISSGYRGWQHNCSLELPPHNAQPSPTSAHMDGLAADVDIDQADLDLDGDGTVSDNERYLAGAIACTMIGSNGHVGNRAYGGNWTHIDLLLGGNGRRCR